MIFNIFNKFKSNKIGGDIAYYNLEEWWSNDFSEEERTIIREIYKPFGAGDDFVIDKGEIYKSSASKLHFLCFLIGAFTSYENFYIGEKILKKAESIINDEDDILNVHFTYHHGIKLYYSNRDKIDGALDKSIEYCKKQINISSKVKEVYIAKQEFLPNHVGYKQLAIIYEKKGELLNALKITQQAFSEGWNDDSKKRIDRLEKKISKLN
ncbi:hypothetical protein [Clostridium sp. 1001271B_151109_B4]|uniref:hypothetical protein n=1 Tax=Clostridium sp. 1001271B_151109_B4 TaxID=2787148 RepID=UPI0018AA87F0|nr:hypothetical protein [Clostridium sp. 1001271B_151109_B4]